jgi:hypothetical protein
VKKIFVICREENGFYFYDLDFELDSFKQHSIHDKSTKAVSIEIIHPINLPQCAENVNMKEEKHPQNSRFEVFYYPKLFKTFKTGKFYLKHIRMFFVEHFLIIK